MTLQCSTNAHIEKALAIGPKVPFYYISLGSDCALLVETYGQ